MPSFPSAEDISPYPNEPSDSELDPSKFSGVTAFTIDIMIERLGPTCESNPRISYGVAVTIKEQDGIFADANAFHLAYFQYISQSVLKGMLEYPTLHQALRAEEEQIQLLLSMAAHCKAIGELQHRQNKPNSQNVTQQLEYKHALDIGTDTLSANEEEMREWEADISRPPIDLWKPVGQIADSSLDSLEHHPDTSIALNVNDDVRFQSLSPDIKAFDALPDLPSPPPTHSRQQSMFSNGHVAKLNMDKDVPVEAHSDNSNSRSPMTMTPRKDDSVIPQFNDDEDAAYLESNHMEDYTSSTRSTMTISDRAILQKEAMKSDSSTVAYRGSSPGGTSVDIIEILDTPSPPEISHGDHINGVTSDEQVNNENLGTGSLHNSHPLSDKFAAMDDDEDAVTIQCKPLPAKRLRYYRNGLGRSYAKRKNTKRPSRGWIKRKP